MWWRLWGGDGDATLTLWFLFSFYNLDKNPSEESGEDLLFLNQLCSEPGLRTSAQAHPPPRHHQWFVWRQNEDKYKKIIVQLNISLFSIFCICIWVRCSGHFVWKFGVFCSNIHFVRRLEFSTPLQFGVMTVILPAPNYILHLV